MEKKRQLKKESWSKKRKERKKVFFLDFAAPNKYFSNVYFFSMSCLQDRVRFCCHCCCGCQKDSWIFQRPAVQRARYFKAFFLEAASSNRSSDRPRKDEVARTAKNWQLLFWQKKVLKNKFVSKLSRRDVLVRNDTAIFLNAWFSSKNDHSTHLFYRSVFSKGWLNRLLSGNIAEIDNNKELDLVSEWFATSPVYHQFISYLLP